MAANSDLETVLSELDVEYTGRLPTQAIREAQRRGAELVPHLVDMIKAATKSVRAGNLPERTGYIFALYLLTEFRAKEALPAIVEAVSLPGEDPFDLFGDSITEDLPAILAALADDEPSIIEKMIQDQSLNSYVRWEAVQTYLYWVRDGLMTRDEAVDRLRRHLIEAIEKSDRDVVTSLVSELVSYSPHEARDEIEEAFRRRLADTSVVSLREADRSLQLGEAAFQQGLSHCRPTGIKDTVEHLSKWACYREAERRPAPPPAPARQKPPRRDDLVDELLGSPSRSNDTTTRIDSPRVGRNAPCPCGSGKKYKKCCGRRG